VTAGKMTQVTEGLGRFYSVSGIIVHGFGRGKRLHWPTANLGNVAPAKLTPLDGIYAGLAHVRGEVWPAAISSGNNPTFTEGRHSLEAHLIGFDDDIYDEVMTLEFVEHLRSEKKFSGEAELSAQIAEDVRACAELLKNRGLFVSGIKTAGPPYRQIDKKD
jgi:riboflavin kinase / FMN adenylyltransferase